jgi:2-polyprenyl-3-methyl-5-hydroxy-6-metoxy-1,4-benzoquinol methylase
MNTETGLSDMWPLEHVEQVMHCPVCGGPRREEELRGLEDRTSGTAPGTWTLHRCLDCRAAYLDPRPDEKSMHLAYSNYYTHESVEANATDGKWLQVALENGYRNHLFGTRYRPSLSLGPFVAPLFGRRSARIRAQARGIEKFRGPDRRVLDVGCGSGQFLAFAKQMGWRAYGVEPDSIATGVARKQGIEVLADRVSDLDESHDGFFDAVTLSHVIEHAHDPIEMLAHCRRVLKPGGYFWLETPNTDSVGYEFYGRHWRGLETPRHLVLFNVQSIRVALERAGFERISILPCLDAAKHMFKRSAMQQAGRIAEVDRSPLPRKAVQEVKAATHKARSLVRRNPTRSEFVVAAAHRAG